MKHIFRLMLLPAIIAACFCTASFAQNSIEPGFSGQIFFSYTKFLDNREVDNQFQLKRAYVTFKQALSDRINIRFTQDITVDQEGLDKGNIELRLKYAYVNVELNDVAFIKKPAFEVGVVHRPWIDFEQSINNFRSRELMLLDYHSILSSADYGLTFTGQFGEDIPNAKTRGIGSVPGRFGSFSLGVYNGGGYSALEENNNKLLEGRLSLRPLPAALPGFQISFLGAYGKGNIPENPDFRLAGTALSFESRYWATIAQFFLSAGDNAGQFIHADFSPVNLQGWSVFNEIKPFKIPISLTLRFDELYNRDTEAWMSRKALAGLAYIFSNRSKIIAGFDQNWEQVAGITTSYNSLGLTAEIQF